MKYSSYSSVVVGIALALTGCGGKGTTGSGGSTTSASSTKSATVGVTTSTNATSSTGMAVCKELTPAQFQRDQYVAMPPMGSLPIAEYPFQPGVMLGGALPDQGLLQFYDLTLAGKQDLADANNSDFSTCTTCLLVNEDVDPAMGATKVYFQKSGSVDLGTSTFPAITGTITDATLIEVTIDPMTFMTTPKPGGGCVHIASANFMFQKAPASWTCDPGGYADNFQCDCNACGVPDPDCAIMPALKQLNGCGPGQTCAADGKTCMGTVTGWTCAAAKYNENHNVPVATQTGTCDCNCGIHDPDCDNAAAVLVGCTTAGSKCNAQSVCVPPGWTCNPDYYGDKGQPAGGCDCGCGIVDVDCANATKASCDTCNDPSGTGFAGSCDTAMCADAASKINATNNAVCN